MKRILLITHSFPPNIGGIETISELLARKLSLMGHKVTVITQTPQTEAKTKQDYRVLTRPDFRTTWKEMSIADAIIENNPSMQLAWPGIFFTSKKHIILHTWICRTDGRISVVDRIKKSYLHFSKNVISVSQALAKTTYPKATIIPNSFDDKTFSIDNNIDKIDDFVFVGRLVSDKGADLMLHALRHLAEAGIFPKLTILGTGPEETPLKHLTKELGLEGQVLFKGSMKGKALAEEINKHAFQIVPSKWEEPFGVVALEGIACGCIPVVARSGGLPEAIGNAGLCFTKGDPKDLAQKMKLIMGDHLLQKELRVNGRTHIVNYHTDKIISRLLNVIFP